MTTTIKTALQPRSVYFSPLQNRPQNTPENPHKSLPYLGIKGRTESSLQPRGFQPVENSKNLVQEVDTDTGEITTFEVFEKGKKLYRTPQQNRAERYALKSVVNRIFPNSDTSKCSRAVIPSQQVQILKSLDYNKAHYKGLRRCSSVWLCPLCASKISERRRVELVSAIATAKAMGWSVLLMTLTIPHGLGDDVKSMLDNMMYAWRKVTTSRAGKLLKSTLAIKGTIRGLEVTDGINGFHPHFHVLVFSDSSFPPELFQFYYLPLWQDVCVKSGLPRPSDEHGLRVDDGSFAARYASKWGLEEEMTKSHTKTSKGDKGMTPWDMLRDVLKNDSERSRSRFYIYALAFKGRRQLYWSNGLKDLLGVTDTTDQDLIAIEDDQASLLAELTPDDWKAVMRFRCESSLLDIAENSPELIPAFLKSLTSN